MATPALSGAEAAVPPTPTVKLTTTAAEPVTAIPPAYPAYPGPAADTPLTAYPGPPTATPLSTPTRRIVPTPFQPPPDPYESNGDSFQPHISADGRIIAFLSAGFLNNDKNSAVSVFVRDQISQTTTLVNVGFGNASPQISVNGAALSANGRTIAYYSFEGDLVPGDEMDCASENDPMMSCEDLFIYDRETGLTERIPLGRGQGLGGDYTLALSADGRYVAYGFTIYDRETGQTETIPTMDDQPPDGYTFAPQFAANGDVAFVSRADNLVPGDEGGFFDVFVWERQTGQLNRISAGNADSGMSSTGEGYWGELAISSDGRYLAYASTASNLTPDPLAECDSYLGYTRICYNIYLHDRETGQTRLITLHSDGDNVNPSLSADGRFLAFSSRATNLTSDALSCAFPTCNQIFRHDTQTSQTTLISRAPGGAPGNHESYRPAISADGRFIAYTSNSDNLVPDDTNNASDIFLYDRESGQTERVSLTDIGPIPDPLPDVDAAALLPRLAFRTVSGESLRQLHLPPYGFRSDDYCQRGPFQWLNNEYLLLFPVTGFDYWYANPAGVQTTQPAVVNLNGGAWAVASPPADGCDLPVWSAALGRLIEAGDGEVRLRDLAGAVTAVYPGSYPLDLAPSGRRLLANMTWIDLDSGETYTFVPKSEKGRIRFPRPAWAADERRFFSCCFEYGDVTTGEHWRRSEIPGFFVGGMDAPRDYLGSASYWVADDSQLLIRPEAITFMGNNNRSVVPLIDPAAQTFEDVTKRLNLPDSVVNCVPNVAPDGRHFWLSCGQHLENDYLFHYPTSYLISLPSFDVITTTGAIDFRGWSANSGFVAYAQLDDEQAHTGTTWLMNMDGRRWQIDDEAARHTHWNPTKPIAAFRFEEAQRVLFVHAVTQTRREIRFDAPIAGLVWQPDGMGAAVWDVACTEQGRCNGRIYLLPNPLNPDSEPIPLTPPLPDVHTVRWSPDGTRLAFVSGTDLYTVEIK